jgi:hypothetical protein
LRRKVRAVGAVGADVGARLGTRRDGLVVGHGARTTQQEQAAPRLAKYHWRRQPSSASIISSAPVQPSRPDATPASACPAPPSRLAAVSASSVALAPSTSTVPIHTRSEAAKYTAIAGKRAAYRSPDERQQPQGRQSEPAQTHF